MRYASAGMGTKCCGFAMYVCLYVGPLASYVQIHEIFGICVTVARSFSYRRQCNMLCTSCLADEFMLSENWDVHNHIYRKPLDGVWLWKRTMRK